MSVLILVEDDSTPAFNVISFVPFIPGISVVLSETHGRTATATEYPVEEGINVSDHLRVGPQTLGLEVFVTKTPTTRDPFTGQGFTKSHLLTAPSPFGSDAQPPIGTPGFLTRGTVNAIEGRLFPVVFSVTTLSFDGDYNPPRDSYETLNDIITDEKLCRVITSLREYKDMALLNIGAVKSQTEGSGVRLQLNFREVRTVTTQSIAAPQPTEPRGKKKKSRGNQPPSPEGEGGGSSLAIKLLEGTLGKDKLQQLLGPSSGTP